MCCSLQYSCEHTSLCLIACYQYYPSFIDLTSPPPFLKATSFALCFFLDLEAAAAATASVGFLEEDSGAGCTLIMAVLQSTKHNV